MKLDAEGNRKKVMVVNIKDIVLDDNNPHAKLEFNFSVEVGKSNRLNESKSQISIGIFDHLDLINKMITGKDFMPGGIIPGFQDKIQDLADRLADETFKLQEAETIMENIAINTQTDLTLPEIEQIMRAPHDIIYLPDIIGG